jgi:hypothetical protein
VATTLLTVFFLLAGAGGLVLIRTVSTLSNPGSGAGALANGNLRLLTGALGALSCPGMALGTAALVWFVVRQRKKRAETLRLRAPGLGLEFLGNAPDADAAAAELGPFAFLMRGVRRYIENRLRGSREGYDLVVFDYGYTASSDDTSTWRTVVRVTSPSLRLPDFTLAPKTLLEDLGEAFGVIHPVDFEGHPRFSEDYVLRGPDPDAIRGAIGEPALAYLAAHRNWSVESRDGRLMCVLAHGSRGIGGRISLHLPLTWTNRSTPGLLSSAKAPRQREMGRRSCQPLNLRSLSSATVRNCDRFLHRMWTVDCPDLLETRRLAMRLFRNLPP